MYVPMFDIKVKMTVKLRRDISLCLTIFQNLKATPTDWSAGMRLKSHT